MDLKQTNRDLLLLQDSLNREQDQDQRNDIAKQMRALRTRLKDFIATEKARGKSYGSWSAKDFNRPPQP